MPLVINSLRDGHTHACRLCGQKQFQETKCAFGLKVFINKINVYVHFVTDPPVVTIDPSQSPHVVSVGTRLIFYCHADAQPAPLVRWYKNGATALNYAAQKFHQSYSVPTVAPHSTVYSCVATNNAGNATNTVQKSITMTVQST